MSTDKNVMNENKMGVMPMQKLLISMSLPMMVSMLVQALYNVVDSIFVAQVSNDAFTAISLAVPIQMIMIAFSVGTGVGMNVVLSRRLGEKDFDGANRVAENGMFLAIVASLAFAVFGIFFCEAFFRSFDATEAVVAYGKQYVEIITIFSFGVFVLISCERFMQSTGNTMFHMIVQGTGAIINIILDPIMIFGLFGFPRLEVAGAAIATVTGQIVAMLLGLYINHKHVKEINMSFRKFRPNFKIIKDIYKIGIPAIVMQSLMSVMMIGLNKILIMFSQSAVAVLGVYSRMQNFVFMPAFGLTNALIPIIGYNYGARKKQRIIDAIKLSLVYVSIIMLVGTAMLYFAPEFFLRIFKATPDMYDIGIPALKIISTSFIMAGASITLASVFQALGRGMLSLMSSAIRQIIVIMPCFYILAKFAGLNYVWYAFLIAEAIGLIIGAMMYHFIYKNELKKL